MEISVRKNDLVRELQLVQGIVERKNSIPILSNVLTEARDGQLRISATDLDVSVRCGCAAQIRHEGAITLGAKKLYEIARSLPESDVVIRVLPENWVTITCESTHFKLAALPREDFPTLPEVGDNPGVEIPAAVLRSLIARISFAITGEDARYYLAGALLLLEPDAVSMVATDGHRLAYARHSVRLRGESQRILVPRKAVYELARLLEGVETVAFQQQEGHLIFEVGTRTLSSKTIDGQFPAFEKVIAVIGDKRAEFGRERLATAIRRVSLLAAERSRGIRLQLAAGRLELTASAPEQGEARETLTTEYAGASVECGYNAQYLLDFLGAAGSDMVALELKDADSQGMLRPTGEGDLDYRYIIMPMRL